MCRWGHFGCCWMSPVDWLGRTVPRFAPCSSFCGCRHTDTRPHILAPFPVQTFVLKRVADCHRHCHPFILVVPHTPTGAGSEENCRHPPTHGHTACAPTSCVQNLDDSLSVAFRTSYRSSLRPSSLREPRHPLVPVVYVVTFTPLSAPCPGVAVAACVVLLNWQQVR